MSAGFDGGQRLGISRELTQLEADGGQIPPAVAAADDDYTRLVEQASKVPSTSATRTRLASQLVDGDVVKPAEFAELASLGDREIVYKLAIEEALHRYLSIAKAHADDIITEARRCWFTPAIDKLTATANATSAGDTSDDLIRRGHVEAGTGIAMAKVELKAVQKAIQLQRRLANLPQNSTLTSWTNPDLPTASIQYSDQFLDAIRAGNVPWLPTEDEFNEARDKRKLDLQREANAKPRIPGNRMSLRM